MVVGGAIAAVGALALPSTASAASGLAPAIMAVSATSDAIHVELTNPNSYGLCNLMVFVDNAEGKQVFPRNLTDLNLAAAP